MNIKPMQLNGHLQITLESGEALPHVPNHMDYLIGACRHTNNLDGGRLDQILNDVGGGFRALSVYPARRSLGHAGEQHLGFDDVEEELGMSRTYQIEIAVAEKSQNVVDALRDLSKVESAVVQRLATTYPLESHSEALDAGRLSKDDAYEPFERIEAKAALAMESGEEAVTVAVVDTGISLGHPEMQRKLLAGYDTVNLGMGKTGEAVRLIGDSRGSDFNPSDEVGHGCHVAGIIGAQGWNVHRGIGGRCLILPIRVLAAARTQTRIKPMGVGGLSDINAGLKCCVDLGAKVINMSFGTPASSLKNGDPLPHSKIVRYADHYGCILIAAAGNSGIEEKYYPAALPEVICVGSVDRQNRRSSFSTYGDHILLCAPGERIVSTGIKGYMVSSGTSHAAPFVSGVAALLASRARRAGKTLNCSDARRILQSSSAKLNGGFNKETGYGLLNAVSALQFLDRELNQNRPP
ncbi:MAG: S8 family serine peptidase [Saprospiraceae bacterium]|nr:S8 family serine peptidase [Pyrinomonadaceae bacterium]